MVPLQVTTDSGLIPGGMFPTETGIQYYCSDFRWMQEFLPGGVPPHLVRFQSGMHNKKMQLTLQQRSSKPSLFGFDSQKRRLVA